MRPGKTVLRQMFKCRPDAVGWEHEKRYPTWAFDASVELEKTSLGHIRQWKGATEKQES